jgi:heme exporter protein D
MAGRLQGDPRAPGRSPLRLTAGRAVALAAAVAVVAALVASAIIGAVEVLPHVEDGIARDSKLTDAQRQHAAGDRLRLDPVPFDAFQARLHRRERYAVDVPPGARGPFITRGEVVRSYSAFYFLPAIQVRRAPLVFHYRFP